MSAATDRVQGWTDTKQKRHNFYCASTQGFTQEIAVFYLCVSQFKRDLKKRQASLIKTWFIEGKYPEALSEGSYMSQLNLSSDVQSSGVSKVDSAISKVGKSFMDKVVNHGGGLRGLGGALTQKFGDHTGLDPKLFDAVLDHTLPDLLDTPIFQTFNPNVAQQPSGRFPGKIQILAKHLKEGGFDADNLGLY